MTRPACCAHFHFRLGSHLNPALPVSAMAFDIGILALAALAGGTIFLGLPVAMLRSVSPKTKAMLNYAAIGVLIFLLIEAMEEAFSAAEDALFGSASPDFAFPIAIALGFGIGLLGIVAFEEWFMGSILRSKTGSKAEATAVVIAMGIGFHNLSEGLAIGQSYATGAISLALLLVVGFGLHNATEGFGIAAPLSGSRPSWKFLAALGLIGGGPTFLGAVIGSSFAFPLASAFFLSLAGGAIVYVIRELLYLGAPAQADDAKASNFAPMLALAAGLFAGFATDLVIKAAVGG